MSDKPAIIIALQFLTKPRKNVEVYRGQYACALSTHSPSSPQCTITSYLLSITTNSPTTNPQSKWNHQCPINLRLYRFFTTAPYSLQQFQPGAKQLKCFLQYWTALNVSQVTKYNSNDEATVKGHMHKQQYNKRLTTNSPFNKNMDTTIPTPNPIHIIFKN